MAWASPAALHGRFCAASPNPSPSRPPARLDKLRKLAMDGQKRFEGFEYDVEADIEAYRTMAETVAPYVTDTVHKLNEW